MFSELRDRAYVAFKHIRPLWRAVTKVEKLFYKTGYRTVVEANERVLVGDNAGAERLLSGPLASYVRPAAELVRANMVLEDASNWLHHLNRYIAPFGLAPAVLAPGSSRLLQLSTVPLKACASGPLITVIMAVHNGATTLEMAARSILNQTWSSLKLVIVDDASTDGTAEISRRLAAGDGRVTVLHIPENCGPYVCRNMVLNLGLVQGPLVTCHDADDWAHPQRLEFHYATAASAGVLNSASLACCIRMRENGLFASIAEARPRSPDGALHVANVSALFDAGFLRDRLGYWDCVRFSGDSELLARAARALGRPVPRFAQLAMICLDSERSLSGNLEFGGNPVTGLSPTRWEYRRSYEKWHAKLKHDVYLQFSPLQEPFPRPRLMVIERAAVESAKRASRIE